MLTETEQRRLRMRVWGLLEEIATDADDEAAQSEAKMLSLAIAANLGPLVGRIADEHVTAALNDAANAVDATGSVCINAHGDRCIGGNAYRDSARIVRARIPT